MSTSSRSAIFSKHATSGWEVLVHHLLTVDWVTPNCPASQRDVRFFSNKTIFMRLISSIFVVLFHKNSDLLSIYLLNCEIILFPGHFFRNFMFFLAKNGKTPHYNIFFLCTYLLSWNLLSSSSHLRTFRLATVLLAPSISLSTLSLR